MSSDYRKSIGEEIIDESKPLLYQNPTVVGVPTVYPLQRPHHEYRSEYMYVEPGEGCAQVGCLLSWIPIIGLITFCIHFNAPPMSRRQYFAQLACVIASFVILVNFIFWITWTQTSGCRHIFRGC